MHTYAIKIGEVHFRSDKPITDEQRKEAVKALLKHGRLFSLPNGEAVAYIAEGRQKPRGSK
ncbi:MAG: hypothetical protein AAGL98_00065 [Planctomycetota bacterium]